ncbi:MAG: IS1380 family transposase [Chloroflexia bacterium]|nr:IS1380 family transposase [Chloroflexia bacterium]
MRQSATDTGRFPATPRPVETRFDLDGLTSDGGLLWLVEADEELGLSSALSAAIPDWRRGPVRHSLPTLVRQRVLQIACGYPDQNDASTLRHDPLFKLGCGRLPGSGSPLASQPTLSRLDTAADEASCAALAAVLLEVYLRERERDGIPERILLDLDSTADPTHGNQEGSADHGYFGQHMFHPLLIFDGDTNQLISARLRPGNAHASWDVVVELERITRAIWEQWPDAKLEIRADGGFAVPALYDFCEQTNITYTIGLILNARLEWAAIPLQVAAQYRRDLTGETKVRFVSELEYQAGSWEQARRVVYKAEAMERGTNTRFVVTNRTDPPQAVYDWYGGRGETENWIKDLKRACWADRLSCHGFWANQFRLLLHAAAYWLLDTLRRWLRERKAPRMQLDTLRLRLIKIGGWVRELTTKVRLHLAESHPGQPLWRLLATREGRS